MAKAEVAKAEEGAAQGAPKKRTKKAAAAAAAPAVAPGVAGSARISDYGVLLSPVITEKSSMAAGNRNHFVFKVDDRATKVEIKAAVERIFKVKVDSVNTARFLGKVKRTVRSVGRRAGFKKAYVTLKEGYTIDIVEGL